MLLDQIDALSAQIGILTSRAGELIGAMTAARGVNADGTAPGDGDWFAVEVSWHGAAVRVAVADCGSPSGPRVIDDPEAEHGRGVVMVRALAIRTGDCGDHRAAWHGPTFPGTIRAPPDPHPRRTRIKLRSAMARPSLPGGSPAYPPGSAGPPCNGE